MDLDINVQVYEGKIEGKLNRMFDDNVMLAVQSRLLDFCTPYVPMLEGPLSQTATVDKEGVTWVQPYAHYQYIGISPTGKEFNYTKTFHPLATREWDKAMIRDRGDEFAESIQDIIQRKING